MGKSVSEEYTAFIFRIEVAGRYPDDWNISWSGMLVSIYQVIWRHNPETHNMNLHCHENLTSVTYLINRFIA
jgi:hypothetical protein